jgi:serine/threonine protein kinase
LKVSDDPQSWHGEAYIGQFLRGSRRAVQQLDAYPFERETGIQRKRRRMLYAIETELIATGRVTDACNGGKLRWSADRVTRELRLLLDTIDHLHVNGTSHRDITPSNVFLGPKGTLKLGDFGIARMQKHARGVVVDAYSPAFKPPKVGKHWLSSDDIYQVGLLALTLLSGSIVTNDVKKPFVNQWTAKEDRLRNVLKRAIDINRGARYQYAGEMASSLTK